MTTGGLGTICTDGTQCNSTHCAPGGPGGNVCCKVAACAAGSICANSTSPSAGNCVRENGEACTAASECKSGFCVDGVCCESGCTGQCEACDIPGGAGKCTGVSGAPHGTRAACETSTDVCKALACDSAKDRSKCVGFLNGPSKECARATCKDGSATTASFCDGTGTCKPGTKATCGAFGCADTVCKDTCKSDGDCGSGYICDVPTAKCVPPKALCSGDKLSSIPPDKSAAKICAPFTCDPSTGNCYGACTTSDQCAPGTACSGGGCVAVAGEADSGGCAMGAPARTTATGGALLVLSGLFAVRRRRARRVGPSPI